MEGRGYSDGYSSEGTDEFDLIPGVSVTDSVIV